MKYPYNELIDKIKMIKNFLEIWKKLIDKPVFVVGFITLLGSIIRLYHLDFKPLWLDEAVIYWISNSGSLNNIIEANALQNSAPPFFVILIYLIQIFGDSELILRLIPYIAGVLSIPAMYLLSQQFVGKNSSYFISLIICFSPTLVKYSQELREYSLTFLLSTLMLLFFISYVRNSKVRFLFLLALVMIISVLTQYGLSLLIICLNFVFFLIIFYDKCNHKSKFIYWGISQLLVVASVLLIYFLSLRDQMVVGWGNSSTSGYLYNAYWQKTDISLIKFGVIQTYKIFQFAFPSILFIFITVIGFLSGIRNKKLLLPLLLFIIPTILTFSLSLVKLYPYHGGRHVIFLLPMIYILATLGINQLSRINNLKWVGLAILFILLFTGFTSTWKYLNTPARENIKPVVQTLQNSYNENDLIYIYYAAKPAFTYYYRENFEDQFFGSSNRNNVESYYEELDEILSLNKPIWIVFSHCYPNECNLIPDYISNFRSITLKVEEEDAFLYYVE